MDLAFLATVAVVSAAGSVSSAAVMLCSSFFGLSRSVCGPFMMAATWGSSVGRPPSVEVPPLSVSAEECGSLSITVGPISVALLAGRAVGLPS